MDCISYQAVADAERYRGAFFSCEPYIRTRPLTPAEQAAWTEQDRQAKQRRQEAKGAEARALVLLDARLGPREARLFARTHTLMRPSQLWPGVEYLIPDGGHEMVRVVDKGREQTRLCVVSAAGEPWPDRTMTILDLIESGQERRLWEMANVFPNEAAPWIERVAPKPNSVLPFWYQMFLGLMAAILAVAIVRVTIGLLG